MAGMMPFLTNCSTLYIILTPLRLVNAIYYNLVVHCSFELFNYVVEVIVPENKREGAGNSDALSWYRLSGFP